MSSPTDEGASSLQAPRTFLFDIRKLDVNGEIEQSQRHGHWIPPSHASAFRRSDPKALYRWSANSITKDDRCRWYEGAWWNQNTELVTYKSQSVFWCGNSLGFMTAPNDVSVTGLKVNEPPPLDEWQQLYFCPDDDVPGLSRVLDVGEMFLFGTGAGWISDLGMSLYDEEHQFALPKATGLAGNLATIIAIVAFSCKERHLEDILFKDKAWRKGRWRKHNRDHGRKRERGMVVTIYLDPRNSGSTWHALNDLEWGVNPILLH